MSRRVVLILSTVCLAAALTIAVLLARTREPSWNGRNLSEWVIQLEEEATVGSVSAEAVTAIQQIGTNAIPNLVQWIKEPVDFSWGQIAREVLGVRRNWRRDRAYGSVHAFIALGTNAEPALPELRAYLNPVGPVSGWPRVGKVLVLLPQTRHEIIGGLTNSVPDYRTRMASILRHAPHGDEMVTSALLHSLGDSNLIVRTRALRSLEARKADTQRIAFALALALRHPDPRRRADAASILERYGPRATNVVADIIPLLQDTNASVRTAARSALKIIAPDSLTNSAAGIP